MFLGASSRSLCTLLVGVAVLIAAGPERADAQGSGVSTPFAIENVTVIDVETGASHADQTVVVIGNKITAVQRSGQADIPAGARILDGEGKYLIPGLWEMHAHGLEHYGIDYDYGMEAMSLFVANGVTGVRDMGSSLGQLLAGKRRIVSQQLPAPRIKATGPLLEWAPPGSALAARFGPMAVMVDTAESARRGVDSLVAAGVDLLKVHNGLSRETYFGITEQGTRRHIAFAGHVPDDVTVVEASDAGQRSIEHLAPFDRYCADESASKAGGLIEIDEAKCEAAFSQLARNGTFLTPTLLSTSPMLADSPSASKARLRHIKPAKANGFRELPTEVTREARARHASHERLTRMALNAGVTLLTGTDTGAPYRLPGWATQEELALLVAAGLSPLQALQAATINPARFFEMTGMLGTVEPGKLADLLLLDGDPLENISNTTRISAVVVDGRLFDREAVQRLLDNAVAVANL